MFNEKIKQIFFKGEDDIYIKTGHFIIQTDKGFYRVDINGFEKIDNFKTSEYSKYQKYNLEGLGIIEAFTNAHDLYIRLSDDRLLSLSVGEGGVEFRVRESYIYEDLKSWFNSEEPREDYLQKLSFAHTRWTK